ncbi:acrosomal protein KIAA1210 homolog isoform X2 [Tamandua tetradactyla]
MAESISEASGSPEILEASDEGKKKSKFKALKNFFGKKKKRDCEDAQGGRRLKPNLSSGNINTSSLKPVLEVQQTETRATSSMGNKALSHDSIFMLEPELEISASKMCPSLEPQRGRTLQTSQVSRTLPRSGLIDVSGTLSDAVFEALPQYIPRSGIWAVGSMIAEISTLHPPQPSISPPLIQPDTFSKDFEEIPTDDELLKSSQQKSLLPNILAMKVKPKQEESNPPLASEEKSTIKPKEGDQKKLEKDSAGPSSQEQSNKAEICDTKTTDEALNTDAAGSLGYRMSEANGRQHGGKGSSASGMNECGTRERSLKQFSQGYDPGVRTGPPPAKKTARDCALSHLPLEKQFMEQSTTPQEAAAIPQELLSDKDDVGRRNVGIDFESKKASAPQPIPGDMKEFMVSGFLPYHEFGASGAKKTEARAPLLASGAKKTEARAPLLSVVESPSTTQEDIRSVSLEAQVFMDFSYLKSEEEEASSLDSTNAQFKMESALDILNVYKEKPTGNVLQASTVSASDTASTMAEGDTSAERLPPRSRSQAFQTPEDCQQVSSDSESTSKEGSGSEEQLAPGCLFQALGEPADKEVSTKSNSCIAEDWSSAEEVLPPRNPSQALEKSEDHQEVVSVSGNTLEVLSTFMEQLPPKYPCQLFTSPVVQQQVSSGSADASAEWNCSVEPVPPSCILQSWVNPEFEQQVSAGPESDAVEWGIVLEPLPPRIPSKRPRKYKGEQQVSSGPEISPVEATVSMELLSSIHHSQPLMRSTVEQVVSTDPDIHTVQGGISMEPLLPKCPFQLQVSPKVEQRVSAGPEIAAVEDSICMELLPSRCPPQPLMTPVAEQEISACPESAAVEGDIPMEPLPPTLLSLPLMNPKVQQKVFLGSEDIDSQRVFPVESLLPNCSSQSLTNSKVQQTFSESAGAEEGILKELLPPGPSQPLVKPKLQSQNISLESASASAEESSSVELLPPRHTFQPEVSPKVEQFSEGPEGTVTEESITMELLSPTYSQSLMRPIAEKEDSSGSMSASAEWSSSVKLLPHKHPFQAQVNLKFEQQVSAGPESAAINSGISMELIPPRTPPQPLMKPKIEPQDTSDSVSASAKWSSSMESLLPRYPFQPWMRPKLQQGTEGTAVERSNYMELLPPRHHSHSLKKPIVEQEVSSGPVGTSAELIGSVELLPPKHILQLCMNAEVQQQVSAGVESAVAEGGTSMELLPPRHPSQSLERHNIQQISSGFEGATVEGGISGRSLPPRYPAQFVRRSKVQDMSSPLENPVVEDISKKSLLPRHPSQSFVKFMAQQIFSCSESPAIEGGINVDPLPQNHPSKSLLRPQVEHQVFSGSESIPDKWSSSKEQLPPKHFIQAMVKPEHQQELSTPSESFLAECWSSKVQLPSRHPFQTLDGSELQSQIFSMDSASVSAEWGCPEDQLPPRHPFQAFGNPENQQQVYSCSMSATAEGISFESNPGNCILPRGSVSPSKTKKESQGSEDLSKSISTLATKSMKFTITPACQTSHSGGLYCKEEVLESGDQNNNSRSSSPISGTDVQNLFGVRLKKIHFSQRYKDEKQDDFTELPSSCSGPISSSIGKKQQVRRSTFQRHPGTSENLTTISDLAEKQQVRPKSEDMTKNQPAYKIPEKVPDKQPDDAILEPTWITMAKRRQRSFQAQVPMKEPKTKETAGAKSEAKEHQYGGADLVNPYQPRRSLTSSIYRQEKMAKMKQPKSTQPVGFEDEEIFQVPSMERGTRQFSSLSTGLHELGEPIEPTEPTEPTEPIEPVWFSLAKKKAKAWGHIADITQ